MRVFAQTSNPSSNLWTAVLATLLFVVLAPWASAAGACLVERGAGAPAPFTRHFGQDCTQQEREAQAVTAGELLDALKAGRGIDLERAVVTGDVVLDQLPPLKPDAVFELPSNIQDVIPVQDMRDIRLIAGPVTIKDSLVRGTIKTNLAAGWLVINGPVTMTGTTFERMLDLSHVLFGGVVDGSHAVILREGFFIRSWFGAGAKFEETAFGTHTRFHRADFAGPVTFHRSGFNGLAEFLEVQFRQEARFGQAYFRLGAGFSGSRFGGMLDFSEARFEREAFFTFTVFAKDAYFRRATFSGQADFSDAEFRGVDDFSKVMFSVEPRFTRTKLTGERQFPHGLQDPRIMYGIVAVLLLFMVWFVYLLKKQS
ncbi:MAG: pentapeptide repeat-containing protein [Nitrospirota bacterium]|nr:pentapeptide repeat-containing protein [Nitrospirota bacterium]